METMVSVTNKLCENANPTSTYKTKLLKKKKKLILWN